jgi:hypothetical protein
MRRSSRAGRQDRRFSTTGTPRDDAVEVGFQVFTTEGYEFGAVREVSRTPRIVV